MKQVYYLTFISKSGLQSKQYEFLSLNNLFDYIKKNDSLSFSYVITKKF